jgi:hypothetical protein
LLFWLTVTEAEALLLWFPEVTTATAVCVPGAENTVVHVGELEEQAPDQE